MKSKENSFFSNLKSIGLAVFIALLIRSFVAEPFNIPSGSMKPNLLVGDFIFVTKWSYGYSKHSLPFSIPLIPKKIFSNIPNRGDIVVFKTPEDNRTDYIKRVIGLPGDKIRVTNGEIYLNENKILRKKLNDFIDNDKNAFIKRIRKYLEYHDDLTFEVLDIMDDGIADNTKLFLVPEGHFFVMGDNRDNSQDSRFKTVGFIPIENLVGKARFIFFSLENSRFLQIWKWPKSIRGNRIFKKII
ncbi:MAG: signal peptidase I [Pelagibacteraceae bacterium]|nr:signal peptidase I [Pelagibacteraceae bacterium]MBT4645192.1 signal peptidase I [Pelagibacteraceae bacterium]MBT6198850.1 signal peptidase I [Pelagibacteraceae bacterium]